MITAYHLHELISVHYRHLKIKQDSRNILVIIYEYTEAFLTIPCLKHFIVTRQYAA